MGEAVLKPSQSETFVGWLSGLLTRLDGRDDFRVSPPLPARTGSWCVEGWAAWRYERGAHQPRRWLDILGVGDMFHAAVRNETLPPLLTARTDRWAVADRVAWGELPLTPAWTRTGLVQELVAALRPVVGCDQLVHGDLTRNVLFQPHQPPLVIDVSPYWRSPEFASAIVVVDALIWEGADEQLITALPWTMNTAQYLLRSLLFRAVTDLIQRPHEEPAAVTAPYQPALETVLRLGRN